MKKCWIVVSLILLLSGCGEAEVMETVGDELMMPVLCAAKELTFALPDDAAKPVITTEENDRLYFCNGYSVTVQTFRSGDLNRTVQSICGYDAQKLTLLQTKQGDCDRYDWVFTCAGEGGNQVGRAAVLDDGNYHYCVSVMADESRSGELEKQWDKIFSTVNLSEGIADQGS